MSQIYENEFMEYDEKTGIMFALASEIEFELEHEITLSLGPTDIIFVHIDTEETLRNFKKTNIYIYEPEPGSETNIIRLEVIED